MLEREEERGRGSFLFVFDPEQEYYFIFIFMGVICEEAWNHAAWILWEMWGPEKRSGGGD